MIRNNERDESVAPFPEKDQRTNSDDLLHRNHVSCCLLPTSY